MLLCFLSFPSPTYRHPDKSDSGRLSARVYIYLFECVHACGAYFWIAVSRKYDGIVLPV